MEKEIMFFYDKEGDVLDISIGKPKKALTEELTEDIFIRVNQKQNQIVGFMIMNFTKSFVRELEKVHKPIVAKIPHHIA